MAARIVVSVVEDTSRDFGIEELVDGVYVTSDSLEERPELVADTDVVWAWLAEREEARAKEQGAHLGIVWAGPSHV